MQLLPNPDIRLGVIGGGYAKTLSKQSFRIRCITQEESDIACAPISVMIAKEITEAFVRLGIRKERSFFLPQRILHRTPCTHFGKRI